MHCTLLVPDLIGSPDGASAAADGLPLPVLEKALARARAERGPFVAFEGWLCSAFGVERQQDWPVAPLTLSFDGGDPAAGYWLRADPVHLQLQRDRVALIGSPTLQLTQPEAGEITAALNRQFAPDGLRFEARAPLRWYLRLEQPPALVTETLSAAAGRNVREVLPSGPDAPRWRQILNEIQMLLHALPLNTEREAAGVPAVNSVWLWGGGVDPSAAARSYAAVWSDDALARALALRAGAHGGALPAGGEAWLDTARIRNDAGRHLVVLDHCAHAAAYGDMAGWRTAISHIENAWMKPLVSALRKGVLDGLVVAAPCSGACWRFELTRRSLYRLWARQRPLSGYGAQ
jgi:hypothetical protein